MTITKHDPTRANSGAPSPAPPARKTAMTIASKAVVFPNRNQIELRDVQVKEPKGGDVLIRTAYTSISAGTERMLLSGQMPHPALSFPVVPGYETVGKVVEVGKKAPQELLGRWVYIGGAKCFKGVNPAWGGQSQYLTSEHDRVVVLGDEHPERGVLLALLATALHGIERAQVQPGDRVLVLGQGIVGHLAARLLKRAGAEYVIVADQVESRLNLSQADQVINVRRESLEEAVGGSSVNLLVEATGSMKALAGALPMLANHGRVLLLGYYDTVHLPYAPLFMREAELIVAREWRHGPEGDLPRARDIIANHEIDLAGLLTHRVPLGKIQAAYRLAFEDPECLKVVLEWPEE
jgi:bacteriochlorophyllide a dehydrogenase